ADPWMDEAGELAAAEQPREEEQRRMEQREAGQPEQHQAGGGDPVVGAGAAAVAVDFHGIARMDGIAGFYVMDGHGRPLPARRLPLSSSSRVGRLAPSTRWWTTPTTANSPIAAMPTYFAAPFHSSTSGLMRGSLGRSE